MRTRISLESVRASLYACTAVGLRVRCTMSARTRCACDCTLVSMHNLQLTIGARNRWRLRNRTPQAYQCVLHWEVPMCLCVCVVGRCVDPCPLVWLGRARSFSAPWEKRVGWPLHTIKRPSKIMLRRANKSAANSLTTRQRNLVLDYVQITRTYCCTSTTTARPNARANVSTTLYIQKHE